MFRLIKKHPDKDHNHKVCAVAFKGSRVVSYGFNSPRTEASIAEIAGSVKGMYSHSVNNWVSYCTHAEVAAIKKANTDVDTIVVARHTKSNQIGMAKPCNICIEYIRQAGIKNIIYTNQEGKLTQEE